MDEKEEESDIDEKAEEEDKEEGNSWKVRTVVSVVSVVNVGW